MLFVRVTRKSRYLYLTIPDFDTSQVKFFDPEAEEKLRKLYSEFYARAMEDYRRGVLPEPPKPVDDVIKRIRCAKVALVIEGKPKEGAKARLRLPRNDLDEGTYVLNPVYMEIDKNDIGFYVLEPMSARDVVTYLRIRGMLDEKSAEELLEALDEYGMLNMIDLIDSMLTDLHGTTTMILTENNEDRIGVLKIESVKSLKLVVRAYELFIEPTEAFTRTLVNDVDMGITRTPTSIIAWRRSGNETVVIGARTWS